MHPKLDDVMSSSDAPDGDEFESEASKGPGRGSSTSVAEFPPSYRSLLLEDCTLAASADQMSSDGGGLYPPVLVKLRL